MANKEKVNKTMDSILDAIYFEYKNTHCKKCGEWLAAFDQCDQCGMVQK